MTKEEPVMYIQSLATPNGKPVYADKYRRVFYREIEGRLEVLVGSPRRTVALLPLDVDPIPILMSLAPYAPVDGYPDFTGWGASRDSSGCVVELRAEGLVCYKLENGWFCDSRSVFGEGASPKEALTDYTRKKMKALEESEW